MNPGFMRFTENSWLDGLRSNFREVKRLPLLLWFNHPTLYVGSEVDTLQATKELNHKRNIYIP